MEKLRQRTATPTGSPGRWLAAAGAILLLNSAANAEDDKLGEFFIDFNLRQEFVEEDNPAEDASALTLRTGIGYRSASAYGFSAVIEVEDSRIVAGQDNFTVGPTNFNPGAYSVIADPESTEIDQAYLQYQAGKLTARLGAQYINVDNQRYVGSVAWRQDRQSFDALAVSYQPVDSLTLQYAYITRRNRVFASEADIDSSDNLLHAAWDGAAGTLTAYAYLLENDDIPDDGLDTVGLRFQGSTEQDFGSLSYVAEFAQQSSKSVAGTMRANYLFAELGLDIASVKFRLGYENLGSDDGNYGFSTPLATLHKFNGWADKFLSTPPQGLVDSYLSVGGNFAGANWAVVYHDFRADTPASGVDDLGHEIDFVLSRSFAGKYTVGAKLAAYSEGDVAAGKVDTNKFWVWLSTGF